MLLFIIMSRGLMIYNIGKLEVEHKREQNIWFYALHKRKEFILLAAMMLGFSIGSLWYPGLVIFTLFQLYFLPIRKNTLLAKVIQRMGPSIIGLILLMLGISFLLALTINNELMIGQFPLLDLQVRYNILFVLPWMRSWDNAL